jgi:hypothetical protein
MCGLHQAAADLIVEISRLSPETRLALDALLQGAYKAIDANTEAMDKVRAAVRGCSRERLPTHPG